MTLPMTSVENAYEKMGLDEGGEVGVDVSGVFPPVDFPKGLAGLVYFAGL